MSPGLHPASWSSYRQPGRRAFRRARFLVGAVFVAGVLPSGPAAAQALKGVVLEEGAGTPVADATVELVLQHTGARSQRVVTDSLGAFQFQLRTAGLFLVVASHPGYRTSSDTVKVGAEEEVVVELTLSRAAIPLQPLVVKARARDPFGGFYARSEQPGFGHFLKREEIELRAGYEASRLVQGFPGVRIVRVRRPSGGFVNLISTRSGVVGECFPIIYIDGMPFRQLEDSGVDDLLTPQMLEGVEVYSSMAGVPAQFMSLNPCGVVAFWTRNEGRGKWSWKKLAIGVGGFILLVLLAR